MSQGDSFYAIINGMHNLENYETFLDIIMPSIDRKFESQKEYISCAKGCAQCCKNASMPFSDIEFDYLKEGYNTLDDSHKSIVIQKIKDMIDEKIEPACPFLFDEVCSVYKYRGLICRMFGLLLINESNEYTIPFCIHDGLNYSKIFDETTGAFSEEKKSSLGIETEPVFYQLSRSLIFSLPLAKDLNIIPNESKPLIEWLKNFYAEYEKK